MDGQEQAAFAPVPRLDPAAVLAALERQHGLRLTDGGPCPGGNVGASYVGLPDGGTGVLTWQGGVPPARHRQVGELTAVARARGVPAPAYRYVLPVSGTGAGGAVIDGVAIVQERLPGAPPARLDADLLAQLVEANRRLRGALRSRPDVPPVELHLRASGPGYCRHEPLAAYSDRTRELLDRVHAVGAAAPEPTTGDDLLHLDFQPANVLVDDTGGLTGVIDWDGAARGDGRLDLVVLLFALREFDPPAELVDRLHADVRADLDEPAYTAYWASVALRQVDWAIRHFTAADVTHWLDVADALAP